MIYELTVPQFIKTLKNLNNILDKAAGFADSKKFETEVLLNSRLAPDMLPLLRQIHIACDTAKLGASRLTGKAAPVNEDNEKTLSEIKARIDGTIAYLKTMNVEDYKNALNVTITTPRWEGKTLTGEQYAVHHVIPNFYFHVTAAYSILRHNGVDIGKKDFLGELPYKLP